MKTPSPPKQPPKPNHLILCGFMGTGKSTLGNLLAKHLKLPFIDMDTILAKHLQAPISEIFARHGEAFFRDQENTLVQELCDPRRFPSRLVIATGGGALLRPQNRDLLSQNGTLICLQATLNTLLQRLAEDTTRPLLQTSSDGTLEGRLRRLFDERAPIYNSISLRIDTTNLSPAKICSEVLAMLEQAQYF